jgi:DNA-binding XRE family transcriptional regulator
MIRLARELAGIDQADLAKRAGVSRKTVVAVERSLPARVDARRRLVLERIRSVFETTFGLEFSFPDDPAGEGVRKGFE